jgi:putative SOS response-associated peptidase YedK
MGIVVSRTQLIKLREIELQLGAMAALQHAQELQNGFEYGNAIVIKKAGENNIEAVPMHWELIPSWVQNMEQVKAARKQGIPWLNATSEKLLESNMFRHAALHNRCLVLATHFYEWRKYKPVGAKKEIAYPYAIEVNNAPYFYMAGIWQPWVDKQTGEALNTFAIVTTAANPLMQAVHNVKRRMPTILTQELAHQWIMNEHLTETQIKQIAQYQLPSNQMQAYTIAKDFKLLQNPLAHYEYEGLPPLAVF